MARLAFHERPEFLLGRSIELRVSRWARGRGWYVIPSYDYSGSERNKAPRLQGLLDAFPVPDLDIARPGSPGLRPATRRWLEVKAKRAASWSIKTRQYEHGIEHFDDYMRVAEITGTDPWVAIVEWETVDDGNPPRHVDPRDAMYGRRGQLLIESFAKLGAPRRATLQGRRMAYWPRRKFWLADILNLDSDIEAAA